MNDPTKWAKNIEDRTTGEIIVPVDGDLRVLAEFHAHGHNQEWRHKQVETMMAVFLSGMRGVNKQSKPSKSSKPLHLNLRWKLLAIVSAIHIGAVRWNESGELGYRFAGLLAYATDAIMFPRVYLFGESYNDQLRRMLHE